MEPHSLGWEPLLLSWIETLPEFFNKERRHLVKALFLRFTIPLLWLIGSGHVKEMCPTSESNLIKSLMNIFDSFLDDFYNAEFTNTIEELDTRAQIEGTFFFSAIWSLGGTLYAASRAKFDQLFRALLQRKYPAQVSTQFGIEFPIEDPPKSYIFIIPSEGSVFDYRYIKEGKGKWKLWEEELMTAPPIPRDIAVNQIIVTTVETVRNMAILKILLLHQKALMFVGPTGTGKSAYVIDFLLKKNDTKKYVPLFINFSAQTTANQTQDIIMSKLDKRRKGVYAPPIGKQSIIFVDDVSMPLKETYGAQPPIELLRQWFDHGIWYDRKEVVPLKLIDIQFVCAMAPPGANTITPRFARHFNHICIDEFEDNVLVTIFSKIMTWHLDTRSFSSDFNPIVQQIVSCTLYVYKEARKNLLPTPAKSHYLFNLRDFSRVIQVRYARFTLVINK